MSDANVLSIPFPCRITVIQETGEEGKTFDFDTKKWCLLGSHPDCDIRIKHGLNAPLHALVFVRPDGVYLQGVHSDIPVVHPRTGTELIEENEVRLSPGDSFCLGRRGFRVDFENPAAKCPKSPQLPVPEHVGPLTRSSKKAASEGKAVQRPRVSEKKRKPHRRLSLVVEAHGERFVSQKRDSESLLSKTQIARLSEGGSSKLPFKSMAEKPSHAFNVDTEEDMPESTLHPNTQSNDAKRSFFEDEKENDRDSTDLDVNSRVDESSDKEKKIQNESKVGISTTSKQKRADKISLPPTPKTKNPVRMAKSASKQGTLTARERKNLIYARLSLGLSALPGKKEMTGDFKTTKTVALASRISATNDCKLDLNLHQSNTWVPNQDVGGKNPIRSPLADKSPLLNIQPSAQRSGSVVKECRTPSAIKKCPGSVLRSSKSTTRGKKRSVAFAPKIELERGTHYSPFRPSVSRTTSFPTASWLRSSQDTSVERLGLDSPIAVCNDSQTPESCGRGNFQVEKAQDDVVEVFHDSHAQPDKEDLEEQEDHDSPTCASDSISDSSSPQTGDSTDSTASRLTGAISSIIKRLSGNGELQDIRGSSTTCGSSGRSQTKDSKSENLSQTKAATEPLMSADEAQDLSNSKRMSVSRRLSFMEKVLGAAAAVRNVMADSDKDTVSPDARSITEVESPKVLPEELKNDRTSVEGMVSRVDECAALDAPSIVVRGSSGESQDKLESERVSDEANENQAATSPSAAEGTLSSNELRPDVVASENQSNLSDTTQRLSLGGIFGRLTRGIGVKTDSPVEISADPIPEDLENTVSLNRTTSYDSNDSQDTADTFERELEIRVARASFPSRSPSTTAYLEELEELECLIAENEKNSPGADTAARSAGPDLDQSEEAIKTNVSAGRETLVDRDEITHADECTEREGADSECSEAYISSKASEASVLRFAERRSSELGPESIDDKDSVLELSEETRAFEEPRISDDQTVQKDAADLEAELSKLLVVELREKLRELNMSIAGRKAELVERLKEHFSQETEELLETEEETSMESVSESKESEKDESPVNEEETDVESVDENESPLNDEHGDEFDSTDIDIPTKREQAEVDDEEELESIAEVYRRKTVKELRQILKDRNLDVMSKLRKEQLIKHMIAEGVELPEGVPKTSNVESPSAERILRSTRKTRHTPAPSRRGRTPAPKAAPPTAKSLNRLTVAELRSLLKEQDLCQQGTKRVLIDRILSNGESKDGNALGNQGQE